MRFFFGGWLHGPNLAKFIHIDFVEYIVHIYKLSAQITGVWALGFFKLLSKNALRVCFVGRVKK